MTLPSVAASNSSLTSPTVASLPSGMPGYSALHKLLRRADGSGAAAHGEGLSPGRTHPPSFRRWRADASLVPVRAAKPSRGSAVARSASGRWLDGKAHRDGSGLSSRDRHGEPCRRRAALPGALLNAVDGRIRDPECGTGTLDELTLGCLEPAKQQ
jgi:hypothetical protein